MEPVPATSVVIVTGGDPVDEGVNHHLPDRAFVIAADSGLATANRLGLRTGLLIGDFDSVDRDDVDAAHRAGTELDRHPEDKDATDLELALVAAVGRGARRVVVVGGASFDRLDHLLANALVLGAKRFASMSITWHIKDAVVTIIHDTATISGEAGDVVTLLPLGGDAIGVTTEGLRWGLSGETLRSGSTRGVSNELVGDTATVSLEEGTLLAVQPATAN